MSVDLASVNLAAHGAEAAEFASTMTGDPHRWTGRAIVADGRVWVEIAAAPGASQDWTATWFAGDGHAALGPVEILAGEEEWLI